MKKIVLSVGILTGLGLLMTYAGHGQTGGRSPKKEKAVVEMQQAEDKEAKEIEAMHQALSRDLKSALGTEISSYGLSQKELIVNGKKQSSALHKQMAGKYLKKVIDMSYHYDIQTGRVFK